MSFAEVQASTVLENARPEHLQFWTSRRTSRSVACPRLPRRTANAQDQLPGWLFSQNTVTRRNAGPVNCTRSFVF
jgi:hypothetical protein